MSFLIKRFLRKLIEQYLNIYDQINLEKGELQLPSGHLNQSNINKILREKNLPCAVAYSEYSNLGISIPIIEIMSKPIVFKMESLRIVLVVNSEGLSSTSLDNNEQPDTNETQKQNSNNRQKYKQKQGSGKNIKKSKNSEPKTEQASQPLDSSANDRSYFKSLVNRLLTNMEVEIKRIEVIVRYASRQSSNSESWSGLDKNQYKLTLQNFSAKNSLSLLEANILKKVICMSKLAMTVHSLIEDRTQIIVNNQQATKDFKTTLAEVCDLNMSLNIDYTRVNIICLLDKLSIALNTDLINWLINKVNLKQHQKQKKPNKSTDQPQRHRNQQSKKQKQKKASEMKNSVVRPLIQAIQLKINEIKLSILDSINSNSQKAQNIELCSLTILGLQIQKQKRKIEQQEKPLSSLPASLINSTISMYLHSIMFTVTESLSNKSINVMMIKMSQRRSNTSHTTIQTWSKSKRKQLKIKVDVSNSRIESLSMEDVQIGLSLSQQLIHEIDRFAHWTLWVKSQFYYYLQQQKNSNKKVDQLSKNQITKKNQIDTSFPQIIVSNFKLQACLNLNNHKIFSVSLLLPEATRVIYQLTTQQLTVQTKIINVYVTDLQMIALSDLKLKIENIKIPKLNQQQKQITTSIHNVNLNVATENVRNLLILLKSQQFKQFQMKASVLNQSIIKLLHQQKFKGENKIISKLQSNSVQNVQQIQNLQTCKNRHNSFYFRINSMYFSLGCGHRLTKLRKFNPVLLMQVETLKVKIITKSDVVVKISMSVLLKSISAVSPHNLSTGAILRAPVGIRFRSREASNKSDLRERMNQSGAKIKQSQILSETNSSEGNSGLTILNSINIDVSQQHIQLMFLLCRSMLPQSPKHLLFTEVSNSVQDKVTFKFIGIPSSKTSLSSTSSIHEDSASKSKIMQVQVDEQKLKHDSSGETVTQDIILLAGECQQIYLFDLSISIAINGQLSEPISLKLNEIIESTSITNIANDEQHQDISEDHKNKIATQKVNSLKSNLNTSSISEQKGKQSSEFVNSPQKSKIKQVKFHQGQNERNIDKNRYVMEKGIIFRFHDECRYILEVKYSAGRLALRVKHKYELHLFQGIEQYCSIEKIEIRCIKIDKYQKYKRLHKQDSLQFQKQKDYLKFETNESNAIFISLDWELLEEDRIDHLRFLIQTEELVEYKICRLMTNSIKYKLYGLCATSSPVQTFQYYVLEQVNEHMPTAHHSLHTDTSTHRYYLMPFLVLLNNLSNHAINLSITNKKSSLSHQYNMRHRSQCVPLANTFDYYMKQYMIKLKIEDSIDKEHVDKFESEDHYFNTFFMVNEAFENVIEMRSLNTQARRYVRIRESFMLKTKILQIGDCLSLQNKTMYDFEICIQPSNIGRTMGLFKGNPENNAQYKMGSHSISSFPNKLKKDDKIIVSYMLNGHRENSIQVPISKLYEHNNRVMLSFNFCRVQGRTQEQQYFQIPVKLQLKAVVQHTDNMSYNSFNLQNQLILTPFVTFTNLCSGNRKVKINGIELDSCFQSGNLTDKCCSSLLLPSNTNKDYNNRWMPINIDQIYEDLLLVNKNWIMQGRNKFMELELVVNQPNFSQNKKAHLIKNNTLYLSELITHKIIEHQKVVYSLVKSLKDNKIQLFFSDHLFSSNVPLKYYIFSNTTDQYFLMNSSQTDYAKYLLFPNRLDDEHLKSKMKDKRTDSHRDGKQSNSGFDQDAFKKKTNKIIDDTIKQEQKSTKYRQINKTESNRQSNKIQDKATYNSQKQYEDYDTFAGSKVYIEGGSKNPVSIMLNKQKHDIFMCDAQYKRLQPLKLRLLQNLKIKQEKYQIENFTVLDLDSQSTSSQQPQFQFSTPSIVLKVSSRRKKFVLSSEIKSLDVRIFHNEKVDILIKDISISITAEQQESTITRNSNQSLIPKPKMQTYQILRVPQESYLLFEGKTYGQKVLLIKNIYVKCKILDLHVNKHLLSVITHLNKLAKSLVQYLSESLPYSQNQAEEEGERERRKIVGLARQKIFIIRSICIHPINLCLAVQTNPSMDFSNMITLPEYSVNSKVFRVTSLVKQVTNHYLTNVIAKFPKLSFVYQNLRSPIQMIKSIIETRNMIVSSEKEEEKRKIAWNLCYIQLQKKYFGSNPNLKLQKRLSNIIATNQRKIDPQLQRANRFLLEVALQNSDTITKDQIFVCTMKNVVSSNITKLSQTVGILVTYYLTNRYIKVICEGLPSESVPVREIQSIRVSRYNKKNAELILSFRRRGAYLKIVDESLACHNLISSINSVLM